MPTYRVLYVPRPGVRLLIEDVEADALVQTPLHWVLTCECSWSAVPARSWPYG